MTRIENPSRLSALPNFGRKDRLSADGDRLFVYGSLMFPEVLFPLLDRVPELEPAEVIGWRVVELTGRVYPGLLPGGGSAGGFLISGLSDAEWLLLDAFEDPLYALTRLDTADGRDGWSYTCPDGVETTYERWDAELFADQHLAAYVENCGRWRRRYEASMGIDTAGSQAPS